MGDYNGVCFVSKTTIDVGDEIYVIPVMYNKDFYPGNDSMVYSTDMYRPVTLPILAVYDNCYTVIATPCEHVTYLEKKFKKPIEEILDIDSKLFSAYLFVHKEIYDTIAATHYTEFGKKDTYYDYEKDYDKYSAKLKLEVKRTVDMIKLLNRERKKTQDAKALEYYEKSLKKDLEELREFDFYTGGMFFHELWMRRMPELKERYIRTIYSGRLRSDFITFSRFNYHLYSCTTGYVIPLGGPQYGNNFMARTLLKASLKIVNDKIAKYRKNRI